MSTGLLEKSAIDTYFVKRDIVQIGAVVLNNPKYAHNVGQALRACVDYAAPELWCSGQRILDAVTLLDRIPREERMRNYRDVALVTDMDPMKKLPSHAVPVIVELVPGAENLFEFQHPENAVYIFGPEDGSVEPRWRSLGHRYVKIDTMHCLNLATAIGTVLYDRDQKNHLEKMGVLKWDR